jgi:hypothetical protein
MKEVMDSSEESEQLPYNYGPSHGHWDDNNVDLLWAVFHLPSNPGQYPFCLLSGDEAVQVGIHQH